LIENLSRLIQSERFINALIGSGTRGIIQAFSSPKVQVSIVKTLTEAFFIAIPQAVKLFADQLVEEIKGAFGSVGGAVGDVGGGVGDFLGGAIGSIGGAFGFANGVDVPLNPKFANDGFGPAMLSAGESVLTADTTRKLNDYLDNQDSRPLVINLSVGEEQLANVLTSLDRKGFRTSA
jgi:hypothetical protein